VYDKYTIEILDIPSLSKAGVGMADPYTIDTTDGIITVRFSRQPGTDEIRKAIDDIAGRKPNDRRLWDFTDSGLDLSTDQLKQLADYGKARLYESYRIALVVSGNLAFGLSKIFEVYREGELVTQRVFRSVEEGRTRLKAR
jgi:hypothetical protein